jgi:hypothetical protein
MPHTRSRSQRHRGRQGWFSPAGMSHKSGYSARLSPRLWQAKAQLDETSSRRQHTSQQYWPSKDAVPGRNHPVHRCVYITQGDKYPRRKIAMYPGPTPSHKRLCASNAEDHLEKVCTGEHDRSKIIMCPRPTPSHKRLCASNAEDRLRRCVGHWSLLVHHWSLLAHSRGCGHWSLFVHRRGCVGHSSLLVNPRGYVPSGLRRSPHDSTRLALAHRALARAPRAGYHQRHRHRHRQRHGHSKRARAGAPPTGAPAI